MNTQASTAKYVSLNEIEVTMKRAARGVGYPWGLAEEAGKAARWLAAHGLPSAEVFYPFLQAVDGKAYADLRCVPQGNTLKASSAPQCPLIAGCYLADLGLGPLSAAGAMVENVYSPLILTAILGALAEAGNQPLSVAWQGVTLALLPGGIALASHSPALTGPRAAQVTIGPCVSSPSTITPARQQGVVVDDAMWDKLQILAARTYVPASERSRSAGAGSSMSDND
jgi:hypothetical protein